MTPSITKRSLAIAPLLAALVLPQIAQGWFDDPAQVEVFETPWTLAVGQLLGDDRGDVVVGTVGGGLLLLEGTSLGAGLVLVDPIPGEFPYASVAVGDFDGDGADDIIASYEVFEGDQVQVFRQKPVGEFSPAQSFLEDFLFGLVEGDINADGVEDVIGGAPDSVVVFMGGPDFLHGRQSYFAKVQPECPYLNAVHSLELFDLDGDDDLDIVLTAVSDACDPGARGVGVLAGDGLGGFGPVEWIHTDSGGPIDFYDAAVGDVNNDQRLDIVVSADSIRIFLGVPGGGWEEGAGHIPVINPRDFLLQDLNDDGNVDIVGGTGRWFHLSTGAGDGTFGDGGTSHVGVAEIHAIDLDLEHGIDLVGNDNLGFVTTFRNISHLDPAAVGPPRPTENELSLQVVNPARGEIRFRLTCDHAGEAIAVVVDPSGREITRQSLWLDAGTSDAEIALPYVSGSRIAFGTYYLRVSMSGRSVSGKFVWLPG